MRTWGKAVVAAGLLVTVTVAGTASDVGAVSGPAPVGGWVVSRVRFEPLDPAATGLSADGGAGHRGALDVAPGGRLLVDLPVEDYVRGIQEVPHSWPAAALQAQAVAARTFALFTASEARARPGRSPTDTDICATDSCQVYAGLAAEQGPGGSAWAAAATATAGRVLLYRGGPILAKYSSSNGGRSVSGGRPYLPSVADPDDAASPLNSWSEPLEFGALTAALGLPGPAIAATRSGATVAVTWARPAPATTVANPAATPGSPIGPPGAPPAPPGVSSFTVLDFRSRVNAALPRGPLPRTLPSDQFTLVPGDGAVVARGGGFGHGIGMSQWGAYGKAQRGLSADAILASYYGGIRPQAVPAGAPATLRVALADVAEPVVRAVPGGSATTAGAFRVVADGAPLATVATGAWKVTGGPRAGTLRVVPPADQAGGVGLDQVVAGRTGADPAAPVAVAFRLSQPALVAVTGIPPQPLPAGDHRVEVPGGPEARSVTVNADAGGGRTATAAVEVTAIAPPTVEPAPSPAPGLPGDPQPTPSPVAEGALPSPPTRAIVSGGSGGSAGRWLTVLGLLVIGSSGWAFRQGRRSGPRRQG